MTRRHTDSGFTLIEVLIVVIILGILGAIVVFAIGSGSSGNGYDDSNTDPRSGWVDMGDGNSKKCDGTTMLYRDNYDGDITSTSPHHEECTG